MSAIVVRAKLAGAVMLPEHPIALDALLMASWAMRENLEPLAFRDNEAAVMPSDVIPISRSACGRIYLASVSQQEPEQFERRFLNRRFPIAEAQSMGGPTMKRINPSAGTTKGYRIPTQMTHLCDDTMLWYAVGDEDRVRDLVSTVGYVGKKRSVGLGRIASWSVGPIDPWEGFPVLLDGKPLRALPRDWPGLGDHRVERRVLTPPYYERWRSEECAVR